MKKFLAATVVLMAFLSCDRERLSASTASPETAQIVPALRTAAGTTPPQVDLIRIELHAGSLHYKDSVAWAAGQIEIPGVPVGASYVLDVRGRNLSDADGIYRWRGVFNGATTASIPATGIPVTVLVDTVATVTIPPAPANLLAGDSTQVNLGPVPDPDSARICYTRSGEEPTLQSTLYTGPFYVKAGQTLTVKTYVTLDAGATWMASSSVSQGYAIPQLPQPTLLPNGGAVDSGSFVTLGNTVANVSYEWQWLGQSTWTRAASNTVQIDQAGTLQVRSTKLNYATSTVATAAFTLRETSKPGQVAAPNVVPGGGDIDSGSSVSLSSDTAGATFQVTRDTTKTWRTLSGNTYKVDTAGTVWFRATKTNRVTSPVTEATWSFRVKPKLPPVTFSPASGNLAKFPATVYLMSDTAGAVIRFRKIGWAKDSVKLAPTSVVVNQGDSIWAVAEKSTCRRSDTTGARWDLAPQLPSPTLSPTGGTFGDSVKVTFDSLFPGAKTEWTLDTTGTWTVANRKTMKASGTLYVRSQLSGFRPSPIARQTYTIVAIVADGNESDNTRELAKIQPPTGVIVSHTLTAGDEDWVSFNVQASKAFRLETSGSTDVTLELYQDTATTISGSATGAGAGLTRINGATAAKWYGRIRGTAGALGPYGLKLTVWDSVLADGAEFDDTREFATVLAFPWTVSGRTLHKGDEDWFQWNGLPNKIYTVSTTGTARTKVEIFREVSTEAIASSTLTSTASGATSYTSGIAQRYYARVTGYDGSMGTYGLTLNTRDTTLATDFDKFEPNNGPGVAYRVELGVTYSATMDAQGDWFWFSALQPGSYQIQVAASHNCCKYDHPISVRQSDSVIANLNGATGSTGGSWTNTFTVPATGLVQVYLGPWYDGGYSFTISKQ